MTKYTLNDKLTAVQRYLGGLGSYASISKTVGTDKSVVMKGAVFHENKKRQH